MRFHADARTGLTTISGMFVAYSAKIDRIHHTRDGNTAIFQYGRFFSIIAVNSVSSIMPSLVKITSPFALNTIV